MNEEINKIKDWTKERKEILLVILFIIALASLIGFKIYQNKAEKVKEIEADRDCHYQAIEKAQEKYKNEALGSSGCKFCKPAEDEGTYKKDDYEMYYQECLINWMNK